MAWSGAVLTDSGGFQVFSLSDLRKVTDQGVAFRSHLDGSAHFFSPESATAAQIGLGADIIMAFDECTEYPAEHARARASMELTSQWAERCKHYFDEHKQEVPWSAPGSGRWAPAEHPAISAQRSRAGEFADDQRPTTDDLTGHRPLTSILDEMGPKDVYVKGVNAVDMDRNVGVLIGHHSGGGTIGATGGSPGSIIVSVEVILISVCPIVPDNLIAPKFFGACLYRRLIIS